MRNLTVFLRIVSILLYISTSAYTAPTATNSKIVIIGAGPSGIAAAVKLLEFGFQDVTILEAEPRIGGRIHTIPFADNVIDLGAQWCHGQENNVVYELVKDLNLLDSTEHIHQNTTINRSNGEVVPDDVGKKLVNIMDGIWMKRFDETTHYNGSEHEFLREEFDKALEQAEYKNIDKTIAAEFFDNFEKEECSAEASDDLVQVPLTGEYKISAGNQALNWKDKGYKTILNLLMRTHELGKEFGVLQEHIRLSKRVKRIDWKRNDNKILIHCEDGEEILADHVIVTVSIGVLKAEHNTLFNPSLPSEKQAAIEEIGFGTVNKIFLEFDKKFWPDYWAGLSLLWTEEDLKNIRGTENFWWEGLFGIFAVDYQPRVFEAWIVGPSARHMETLSKDHIKADCVKLLKRFLKWDIPEPVNVISTAWLTNPNFRGSWSYHTIKLLQSSVRPGDLERPLTVAIVDFVKGSEDAQAHCEKPIVQFAGEATNSFHFSTVHGAIESGWREAKRLAEFYGVNETA